MLHRAFQNVRRKIKGVEIENNSLKRQSAGSSLQSDLNTPVVPETGR